MIAPLDSLTPTQRPRNAHAYPSPGVSACPALALSTRRARCHTASLSVVPPSHAPQRFPVASAHAILLLSAERDGRNIDTCTALPAASVKRFSLLGQTQHPEGTADPDRSSWPRRRREESHDYPTADRHRPYLRDRLRLAAFTDDPRISLRRTRAEDRQHFTYILHNSILLTNPAAGYFSPPSATSIAFHRRQCQEPPDRTGSISISTANRRPSTCAFRLESSSTATRSRFPLEDDCGGAGGVPSRYLYRHRRR